MTGTRRVVAMVALCPYPTHQGTQVLVRGLARAAAARGHLVHLVTYGFGEPGLDDPSVPGLTVHRAPAVPGYRKLRAGPAFGKLPTDLLLGRSLRRVCAEQRVELVHAHHVEGPLVGLPCALAGLPVVFHAHTLLAEELHTYFGPRWEGLARGLGRVLDRGVPRFARRGIALSEEGAAPLRRAGLPTDCVPPGVDPQDLLPPAPPPGGPPTVVYTGNPDRYQDLPLLFAAMARVRAELPDARLRVVTHAALDELRPLAGVLPPGACSLEAATGWDQVQRAVLASHVAALPRARCPGFPVKLLNYLGLGRPVVACRGSVGALSAGLSVVPSGDEAAFAAALLRLLRDPERARAQGEAGRRSVLAEHSWAARMPAIEACWDAALRPGPSRREVPVRPGRRASR